MKDWGIGLVFAFTVFIIPALGLLDIWGRRVRRKRRLAALPPDMQKLVLELEQQGRDKPHLASLAEALLEPGQPRVGFMSPETFMGALASLDEKTEGTEE